MDTKKFYNDAYLLHNPTLHEEDSPWKIKKIIPCVDKILRLNNKKTLSLLDVGGGAGHILKAVAGYLQTRGRSVTQHALDLSKEMLRHQKKTNPAVITTAGDIRKTSFANKQFDLVLMIDVLEHVPQPEEALKELKRIAHYVIFKVPLEDNFHLNAKNIITCGRSRQRTINAIGHINVYDIRTLKQQIRKHCGTLLYSQYTNAFEYYLHTQQGLRKKIAYQAARALHHFSPPAAARVFTDFALILVRCTKKICYINHSGYGLFNKAYAGIHAYAGAETALFEEATELAKDRAFDVHMLVEADTNEVEKYGSITVWTMPWNYEQSHRTIAHFLTRPLPVIRYQHTLWEKLRQIDADVYVHRSAFAEIRFSAASFCKINNKKYVYVVPGKPKSWLPLHKPFSFARRVVCDRASMQLADCVVCLAYDQLPHLPPRVRRKARVIYTGKELRKKKKYPRTFFLFVGRNAIIKRPDLFVKLAKKLPEEQFVMICRYDKPVPKNVKLLKFVPHEKIDEYYSRAIALVSMSTEEGFGNVYIEAWRQGTPVIALTTDIDENICRHQLGYHSQTFEQLIIDAKKIKTTWKQLSKNCSRYFKKNHDITKQIEKYKLLLK